jgi:type II secretory pathway component PulF
MTAFRYVAARTDGASVRGVLEASTGTEAAAVLSQRGLYPVSVEPTREQATSWLRRPSLRAQATVFQSLASLVDAGVPLEQALTATDRVASGALREALVRVAQRVREGASLASALAGEGRLFPGVAIGLVRAGERGVGLAAGLDQAAAQLERESETAARIRGALTYPTLLATVGTLSVGIIVLFVVPRFVAILSDVGQALPLATRLLISIADGARRFGVVIAAILGAGLVVGVRLVQDRRVPWEAWLLGLPLVGPIRHAFATARASRALSALLGSGTPALAALGIAQEAVGNAAIGDRLERTRSRVAEGESLATALAGVGALTETALQLVRIGETSGRVPALLAKAAEFEEREAERKLKGLVALLEPTLILAFAGLVAFVAAALLQAVYSLRPGGV